MSEKNVAQKARNLGIKILQNDPPLSDKGMAGFTSLDDLMQSDIVTIHVPLTYQGIYKTYRLFDENRLLKMKQGSFLINTSRGFVVSGEGLKKALDKKHLSGAVLDVWENEPDIDAKLLEALTIGTPHIAGYSFEGKINGAEMVYNALCRYFNLEKNWNKTKAQLRYDNPPIEIGRSFSDDYGIINNLVKNLYDIERDDIELRKIIFLPELERPKYFESLRRDYPIRREFNNQTIKTVNMQLYKKLTGLGFTVI